MPKSVKVRIKCLNHKGIITDEEMDNLIDALETENIEVVPHAKWEYKSGPYGVAYCSNCNHVLEDYETKYCCDCGARMDKE